MSLSLTAPVITETAKFSDLLHCELTAAAEEIIAARFNDRSWLVFTCPPQLELGDAFIFGTPSNLSVAGAEYNPDDETQPNPTSGSVLSIDTDTRVIWLTGYSEYHTLNRQTVDYDAGSGAETWWVGIVRPQRFEAMRVADLCVEDFTDPVAGTNTAFTWRSHWDRYSSIRVHNGNRHALTLQFEGGSQPSVTIPPYGVVCGRRPNPEAPFVFDRKYIPKTLEHDPLAWMKSAPGQWAGSFELLRLTVEGMAGWCRFSPGVDVDSTAAEQPFFRGTPPAGTDRFWDWLVHPGKLLSVVLDKRDGSVVVQELEWRGFASTPDATWAGIVDVDITLGDSVRFTSAVTPPAGAGPTEWEHDLIPVTSNLTDGLILPLRSGPYVLLKGTAGDCSDLYTSPLALGTVGASGTTVYSTASGGSSATVSHRALVESASPDSLLNATLSGYAPAGSGTGSWIKSGAAIGRVERISASASWSMSELSDALLDKADTTGILMAWDSVRFASVSDRVRFAAGRGRSYEAAGEVVGASVVYDSHPQDSYVDGTPDGLAGPMGVEPPTILHSPVAIEGSPFIRTPSDRGSELWVPADTLHFVVTQVSVPGWWATNRSRVMAGTFEPAELAIACRPARLVEQWNALARALNAVQEVFRADIRHLHRDPLPDGCDQLPFAYEGEAPFAVPAGWICGRNDSDDARLFDWATLWGLSPNVGVPDVDTLAAIDRAVWRGDENEDGGIVQIVLDTAENVRPGGGTETVNGYTYDSWKALSANASRRLWGGAGDVSSYVYITATDAAAVFDSIGVPYPPPPAGERFNPVIEQDASLTVLTGAFATGDIEPSFTDVGDAVEAYRKPSPSGSWIQVWDGVMTGGIRRVGFRLIDAYGSAEQRFAYAPFPGDTDWLTLRREVSSDQVDNGPLSPRFKAVQSAPASYSGVTGYLLLDDDAWRSGTEVYSAVPLLVVAAPEPWMEFVWDSPIDAAYPANPSPLAQMSVTEHVPSSGGLKHLEYAAGAVTPQTLRDDGWNNHGAYHCQVVQRTGVLRSSA